MAEISYTLTNTSGGDALVTWANVTEADTFKQYEMAEVVSEISTHITGTFGGATVSIDGGNITGEMLGLLQIGGTAATATAADIFSLLDRPLYIQPSHTGGTSESVSIYMMVRK